MNNSINEEVDVLDMEIVIGNKTHILTVYPDSNLTQLTAKFAKEKGLSAMLL